MKPVRVSIDVPQAREDVYDFLDVLANHELFTDHMLRDWQCEGPARGVGAKARVTAVAAGRAEAVDIEVIEAERPVRNKERNAGATGARRMAAAAWRRRRRDPVPALPARGPQPARGLGRGRPSRAARGSALVFSRVPGVSVWQWARPAVQVVDRDPAEPGRFRVLHTA